MPENFFGGPRKARIRSDTYKDISNEVRAMLPFLKPSEQEIIRMRYGLDGYPTHSFKEICTKLFPLEEREIRDLDERVERMIGVQKREQKKNAEGLGNVNRPRRKKEIEGIDPDLMPEVDDEE